MTASHIFGPSIVVGNDTTVQRNPEAGPSVSYQGVALIDPRAPYKPGVTGLGVVRGLANPPPVLCVDAVPSALGAATIAAAAIATSGTPLALLAASTAGYGVNFPIVPSGLPYKASNVVLVGALDPGFATVNATSGSATVAVTAAVAATLSRLKVGLTLLVGAATNAWTPVRILSVSGTSIVFDTVMPATNIASPIALANGQFRADGAPVAFSPYLTAGAAQLFDPKSGLCRGVSVTNNNIADTGWTVTVAGYDTYGVPMTETIAVAANATAYGNKCFKFIKSVTPNKTGSTTGTLSIGTSDLLGFNIRSDAFEYADIYWAGAFVASSAGWYAADTSTATATTKDVRGALQVSASGPNATAVGANATNGARSLVVSLVPTIDNLCFATTLDSSALFGATQF